MKTEIGLHTLVLTVAFLACACSEVAVQRTTESSCESPIVTDILVDQTKSMRATSTTMPSAEDFDPLIEKLYSCGGEIEVTFVRDRPDQGPPKIRFPEAPPAPEKPVQGSDEENYEFDDRMAIYGRQIIERGEEIARTRKELEPAVQDFRKKLKDRLARPMVDTTDFNSALNQAEVFLALDGRWRGRPAKYLIINSDALDEKRKPLLGIRSDAEILWINTSTGDAALNGRRFTRIDNFASAVRQITSR